MNRQNTTLLPITPALIDCFNTVITPEENDFLLRMGTEPFTRDELAEISGMPPEGFSMFFDNLLRKGLVWPHNTEKQDLKYELAPILLGWFEVYLSDGSEAPEKKEFVRHLDRMMTFFGKFNIFPIRPLWNFYQKSRSHPHSQIASALKTEKTIEVPVGITLQASLPKIYPARNIHDLLAEYGSKQEIALIHCFCRQWRKITDDPCRLDLPAESCIVVGPFAKHIDRLGIGRLVTLSEARDVIQSAQEKGDIHQVFHEKQDIRRREIGICNCCWDCCGVLGSYNRGLIPLYFRSFFLARIRDASICAGCGLCSRFCPVGAIELKDKKAAIDVLKCIGCGLCVLKCPNRAVDLQEQERDVKLPLLPKSKARLRI